MNSMTKRLICTAAFAGTLALALAPAASAHDIVRTSPVAYHKHYTVRSTTDFPYWLQRDRDFQRWYVQSRYRYLRPLVWPRLVTLYRRDVAYHRHGRHYYPYRQWQRRYPQQQRVLRDRHGD